jgi:hypothetical protein
MNFSFRSNRTYPLPAFFVGHSGRVTILFLRAQSRFIGLAPPEQAQPPCVCLIRGFESRNAALSELPSGSTNA